MPNVAQRSPFVMLACMVSAASIACAGDPVVPAEAPKVSSVVVVRNPSNALSTIVAATILNADSAYVAYGSGSLRKTPFYPVQAGSVRIAILGLEPRTVYSHMVVTRGPGGEVFSDLIRLETGDLPGFLSDKLTFEVTGIPPAGYILAGMLSHRDTTEQYVVAWDGSGQVRWYCRIQGLGAFVAQQPNGNFVAIVGFTQGFQAWPGHYVEFNPGCDVVRRIDPAPMYADGHDFLLTGDGKAHFFTYEVDATDLTEYGGLADAEIAHHYLRRLGPEGDVELEIDFRERFDVDDWIESPLPHELASRTPPRKEFDFDHPNSLGIDPVDGNYIVSFRNFGAVVKFHYWTGAVMWVLGGRQNEFEVIGDPLNGFSAQHSAHRLENGDILLYDNGTRHTPPETRAVQYKLDTNALTAEMVWEYRHDPLIYTAFVGNVQRFSNGNTLIGYGERRTVTEVDRAGSVIWEGTSSHTFYRFYRICSLYQHVAAC